jgi:uncharacterized protein YdhG (YjbR/CyaY superfamily)
MAKKTFKTVAEYIALQPAPVRSALRRVRSTIRKALPEAEEVISYKIPAYRVRGRVAIYFAGWARHYSLYPASGGLVEAFKNQLARYEVSKGTIRFSISEPVPVQLIARIAKFRTRQIARRDKAKASTPKAR